jgi:hypothetical protein
MQNELPHVIEKVDGLRNVDVFLDFSNEDEVNAYFEKCELIGVGSNAIVFLLPPPEKCTASEALLRFEIQNPLGTDWTELLLKKLICEYPSFFEKLQALLLKLEERVRERPMKRQIEESRKSIKRQIAGHNSAFRRDPLITMPINSYFAYQGKWFGIRVKYLNGVSLAEAFPDAELTEYSFEILKDKNPSNVVVGIQNSQVREALIDIWDFTPSNQGISQSGDKLYNLPRR